MKKTMIQTLIGVVTLCMMSACSKSDENPDDKHTSSDQHTYDISITGGKTYKGGIANHAPGVVEVYNPVAFVLEEDGVGRGVSTMLLDRGVFQIGLGFLLDENNRPIHTENQAFGFGEWATENKYGPVDPVSMTLENYKEHDYSFAGEEGTVASFTLTFSGKFKLGADGEEVDVTGKIVVAAP